MPRARRTAEYAPSAPMTTRAAIWPSRRHVPRPGAHLQTADAVADRQGAARAGGRVQAGVEDPPRDRPGRPGQRDRQFDAPGGAQPHPVQRGVSGCRVRHTRAAEGPRPRAARSRRRRACPEGRPLRPRARPVRRGALAARAAPRRCRRGRRRPRQRRTPRARSPVSPTVRMRGWGKWPGDPGSTARARACPVRHPTDRFGVPSGQLPGRHPALGADAGRLRRVLLHPRHACDHGAARPGRAAAPHAGDRGGAGGLRSGSGPVHAVRAEPGTRARAARVGAGLHHRLRRSQPDDPVQGQERAGRTRCRHRGPVHLPDPAGRGHPALPGRPGAGRGGPEAASGAHARSRAAVQHPLRAHVHRAGRLRRRRRRSASPTCRSRTGR